MMIQQGVGTTWGPTPSVILWLYTGIIRPFVTYGAVVWAGKSAMARVASKLLKIQCMGMIRVAPMRQHTPTAGLETILGLPPLDLYIQYLAITTFHHLNLQPRNWEGVASTKKGHIKWIESQIFNLPHSSLQDRCISTHWNRKFNTTIGDGTDIIHDKGLLCYTDGSGQGTGSGSGIAHRRRDKDLVKTHGPRIKVVPKI
jgi:hypothetical protein